MPCFQVVIVDGCGVLHPQGFGSACHLGVDSHVPTIGVAKKLMGIEGLDKLAVRAALAKLAAGAGADAGGCMHAAVGGSTTSATGASASEVAAGPGGAPQHNVGDSSACGDADVGEAAGSKPQCADGLRRLSLDIRPSLDIAGNVGAAVATAASGTCHSHGAATAVAEVAHTRSGGVATATAATGACHSCDAAAAVVEVADTRSDGVATATAATGAGMWAAPLDKAGRPCFAGQCLPLVGCSGRVLGAALAPHGIVNPIYVSVGHRVGLQSAVQLVWSCCRCMFTKVICNVM